MTFIQPGKIGWKTACGIVIANMIGTGVFTSLGYQLEEVNSSWSILILWTIGGLLSLIGALVYAELGTHFKQSGGDYIFLSRTFHPLLGYLYSWTSLTVGFSAPIAIAAMAMVYYLDPFIHGGYGKVVAITSIILVSLFHSFSVHHSGIFHSVFTIIKIVFAIGLILLGFIIPAPEVNAINFTSPWSHELFLPGFAVSLIYVSYAYTGWNSAAYITEEIEKPEQNLPKSLITGTAFVSVVYILLQIVLLRHATPSELTGKVDVALISFGDLFNGSLLPWISLLISIQLISTISGYTWIGPRITFAMARDFKLWKRLSVTSRGGIPVRALWFNTGISILLVLSGSFEQILLYASFVLQLMGTFTIASSLCIKPEPGNYKSPFRPYLQIIFILFSLWILAYTFYERPGESLIGLFVIGTGIGLYFFDRIQLHNTGELPKSR